MSGWSPDEIAGGRRHAPPPEQPGPFSAASTPVKAFAVIGVIATGIVALLTVYALTAGVASLDVFTVHFDCIRDPILGGSWCRATGR